MLERIAREPHPRTPVLGCQISKTLEPKAVNKEVAAFSLVYEGKFPL